MYNGLRVFLQIMTKEEYLLCICCIIHFDVRIHEALLTGLTTERNIRRRIEQLQRWRANGVRTLAEGDLFEIETQRRENSLRRQKDTSSYLLVVLKGQTCFFFGSCFGQNNVDLLFISSVGRL